MIVPRRRPARQIPAPFARAIWIRSEEIMREGAKHHACSHKSDRPQGVHRVASSRRLMDYRQQDCRQKESSALTRINESVPMLTFTLWHCPYMANPPMCEKLSIPGIYPSPIPTIISNTSANSILHGLEIRVQCAMRSTRTAACVPKMAPDAPMDARPASAKLPPRINPKTPETV